MDYRERIRTNLKWVDGEVSEDKRMLSTWFLGEQYYTTYKLGQETLKFLPESAKEDFLKVAKEGAKEKLINKICEDICRISSEIKSEQGE